MKVELNSEEQELIRTLIEEDESDCHEIYSSGRFERFLKTQSPSIIEFILVLK